MGAATHTWDTGTSDVRALQSPSGTGRIASQFNSVTFFTYDIRLTDDQPHWIALYLLDWDSGGFRAQTVDVLDASTNTLLDSQYVAKFSGGVYLVWEVRGHVQIRVTKDPIAGLECLGIRGVLRPGERSAVGHPDGARQRRDLRRARDHRHECDREHANGVNHQGRVLPRHDVARRGPDDPVQYYVVERAGRPVRLDGEGHHECRRDGDLDAHQRHGEFSRERAADGQHHRPGQWGHVHGAGDGANHRQRR